MKSRDHKMLADFFMANTQYEVPFIYKKIFVLGNIEPDKNPFTYLHGVIRAEKFRGHHYGNIYPVMKKLFESLQREEEFGIREYYRLGKLMHYMADAFTFPHNSKFEGTIREHCEYERALHERISSVLREKKLMTESVAMLEDFESMEELHEEYLRKAGDYDHDCRYILLQAEILLNAFLVQRVVSQVCFA